MEFYLTAPDGSRFHFPINPERPRCSTGNRTLTFDIINLGEIVQTRGRVPSRFHLEGFFPGEARKNDSKVKDWRPPKEILGLLSFWRNEGTKLRFLVTDTPINHDVVFDGDGSLEHEWSGGHGDCWYSIRLIEARALVVLMEGDVMSQQTPATTQSRPIPPAPKTYTVKSGDTLWAIGKKFEKDWKAIYNNNKDVIGKDPNLIRPGQVLRIA